MVHQAQSTLGSKGCIYSCGFPSNKLSPTSRHKAAKMEPRSSITSQSKSYNQLSYASDFSSGDISDQFFVDTAGSASSHIEGINMNCVLVSLDGLAVLQLHDLPHPPIASLLHCLHKTSPQSPLNEGTNSILPTTKMKGLRQPRSDSKIISTQDEGFLGRTSV
jgi:hypothetical protein